MISTITTSEQQQTQQRESGTPEFEKKINSSSSETSEEGFVSGGSLPEESFDRLAMQISSFGITQNKNNGTFFDHSIPTPKKDVKRQIGCNNVFFAVEKIIELRYHTHALFRNTF